MPGRVGQGLAQRGQQLLGDLLRHYRVKALGELQRRREAKRRGHLLGHVEDPGAQTARPGLRVCLEREDRGPDLLDRVVERVDGPADPLGDVRGQDLRRRALQ